MPVWRLIAEQDARVELLYVPGGTTPHDPGNAVAPNRSVAVVSPAAAWQQVFGIRLSDQPAIGLYEAARAVRRRAIAPGRPRTFMIRPVVS